LALGRRKLDISFHGASIFNSAKKSKSEFKDMKNMDNMRRERLHR
jgi:hypothetical protein